MLVITRKTNQSIVINDTITITIFESSKDKVKIGIQAPKEINIVREELIKVKQVNLESTKAFNPNFKTLETCSIFPQKSKFKKQSEKQ